MSLPLTASEQLERLYQNVSQSYRMGQYHASQTLSKELVEVSKEEDNIFYTVRGYYVMGLSYSQTEDFGKAVLCYLEGARFAENSSQKEIKENLISIYKNLAIIMGDYRHFDLAHKFNQKGLEVAYELSHESHIIHLLQNDSYEYFEEEKYDSALLALQRIFSHYEPEFRRKINLTNDLGLVYWSLGNPDEAIQQYNYILYFRDSIEDSGLVAKVLHNLGLSLMDKQEYENALVYFTEAADINTREGFTSTLFGNYKNMGKSWYQLGDKDKAIEYYLKAESLFNEAYVDPEDYDIFELIANFYLSNGQTELAYEYERAYNDHLQAFIARQKEIEELDKKYNMELLTQRYFDLLEARKETEDMQQVAAMIGGASLASIILVMGIGSYRKFRLKKSLVKSLLEIERNSPV